MSVRKEIGKIQEIRFGSGGYQDAQVGASFVLGGQGWGVGDFWGHWSGERSASAKWTETDRLMALGHVVMRLRDLMKQANVGSIDKLKNVPVEVTFDGNLLKSWRVLTEVL